MAPPLIAVVTTVASPEQARALAALLLEGRLVACAQISAIESLYRWQGELRQEPEWRLLLKTCADRWPAVEQALRVHHPYALPAIHAWPLAPAHGPYADWVAGELAPL